MREMWLLAEAARQRLKTKKVCGTGIILRSKHLYADVQNKQADVPRTFNTGLKHAS